MRAVDESWVIYGYNTLEPPSSHYAILGMGIVYLIIVGYFLASWLRAAHRLRRAHAERTTVLDEGPAQILAPIEGNLVVVPAPGDGNHTTEREVRPFEVKTPYGIVRVEPSRAVTFEAQGNTGHPLRGGEEVEVAGELVKERQLSTDGYRGDRGDGWVLRERGDEPLHLWRHSRTHLDERAARMGIGGVLVTVAFALLSGLALSPYLARSTIGETVDARVTGVEADTDGLLLGLELEGGESVEAVVAADEGAFLETGNHVTYRIVPAIPWVGAIGAGGEVGGASFFFGILFLVCAVASWVAIIAVGLEGD